MKVHKDLQQKTWPWFEARAGKVSGSELGNLITDKGAIRSWASGMPNSYLHRKLAERWRGAPLETFGGNRQTDQGNIFEGQARGYFSALLETDITEIGGLESDDGTLWCSPDGIIGANVGLEIKCPNADTHVGWLLAGPKVPEEHVLQVQFALYVTGWTTWRFLSYVKDMPHLSIIVEPDGELLETIGEAMSDFKERFEEGWNFLLELNGGPPPKRPPITPGKIQFSWESNDVIP